MLTDQEEDKKGNSLNPLKIALRRRNVKTVQFAPPSYVEPSDHEMTTDEEDEGNEDELAPETNGVARQTSDSVQQSKDNGSMQNGHASEQATIDRQHLAATNHDGRNGEDSASLDTARTSEDGADRSGASDSRTLTDRVLTSHADEVGERKSRKGNVRNTDSFFKDESLETRKINLTPSLLRDDSSSLTPRSSDSTVSQTTEKKLSHADHATVEKPAKSGFLG